ncbi:MAG: ABC transporter ATP-binding protein/permease, partial [Acetobacteraceae bacterium]
WLFLDEATASLDPESEAALYRTIQERLPRTTVVSIAHSPAVAKFHDRRLELIRSGGGGRLAAPAEAAA